MVAINTLTQNTSASGLSGLVVKLDARAPVVTRWLIAASRRIRMPRAFADLAVEAQLAAPARVDREILDHLRDLYRDKAQMRVLMSFRHDRDNLASLDGPAPAGAPPVCAIWGETNRILTAKSGQQLWTTLAPAYEATVAGGHLVMLESADAVNHHIDAFLATRAVYVASGQER